MADKHKALNLDEWLIGCNTGTGGQGPNAQGQMPQLPMLTQEQFQQMMGSQGMQGGPMRVFLL
jgi:hypothetical protein